jgi:hypothetical protein
VPPRPPLMVRGRPRRHPPRWFVNAMFVLAILLLAAIGGVIAVLGSAYAWVLGRWAAGFLGIA